MGPVDPGRDLATLGFGEPFLGGFELVGAEAIGQNDHCIFPLGVIDLGERFAGIEGDFLGGSEVWGVEDDFGVLAGGGFPVAADDAPPRGDSEVVSVGVEVGVGVDVEEEAPVVLETLHDFFEAEQIGRFGGGEEDGAVFVGGGVGSGGLFHLFEVEGVEEAFDAFFEFGLGPDGDDLVFVDEEVEEGVFAHGPEADHAVFEEEILESADVVDHAVGADEFVGDVGVDLAVGVVAQDIEDGVDAAGEHGQKAAGEGDDAA